ncbi:SHOCT domain-containing protein [Tropicimonas sp. IMCC34043]|uniref:SHOCT domain-containing protein n=1 Tax=Tropicimonas sp. IMCC34043 TaxID=2248760 RepID=UPI000E2732FA|nr:SHOCT domain-containing protein [Tropicimonas sp. IMCC34043]
MTDITDHGRRTIDELSRAHGLSQAAVEQMARSIQRGGGSMAQFNIPELGGSGQWMAGGMTMVGDMFNNGLKARVESLCYDLTSAMAAGAMFSSPQTMGGSGWWPADLGSPSSVGGQNQMRYAYFPQTRRLVYDAGNGSPLVVLDTTGHDIGGFSQQQSGSQDGFHGLTFSSQAGQFALSSLPRVGSAATQGQFQGQTPEPVAHNPSVYSDPTSSVESDPVRPAGTPAPRPATSVPETAPKAPDRGAGDPIAMIEKLAALHDAGILTDEEFATKKAELLARI